MSDAFAHGFRTRLGLLSERVFFGHANGHGADYPLDHADEVIVEYAELSIEQAYASARTSIAPRREVKLEAGTRICIYYSCEMQVAKNCRPSAL